MAAAAKAPITAKKPRVINATASERGSRRVRRLQADADEQR
jgi:hypothetical protein